MPIPVQKRSRAVSEAHTRRVSRRDLIGRHPRPRRASRAQPPSTRTLRTSRSADALTSALRASSWIACFMSSHRLRMGFSKRSRFLRRGASARETSGSKCKRCVATSWVAAHPSACSEARPPGAGTPKLAVLGATTPADFNQQRALCTPALNINAVIRSRPGAAAGAGSGTHSARCGSPDSSSSPNRSPSAGAHAARPGSPHTPGHG